MAGTIASGCGSWALASTSIIAGPSAFSAFLRVLSNAVGESTRAWGGPTLRHRRPRSGVRRSTARVASPRARCRLRRGYPGAVVSHPAVVLHLSRVARLQSAPIIGEEGGMDYGDHRDPAGPLTRRDVEVLLGCIRETREALEEWEFGTRMGAGPEEVDRLALRLRARLAPSPPTGAQAQVRAGRLILRPLRAADLESVAAYQTRLDVSRYLYREPMTRDEVAAWIAAGHDAHLEEEDRWVRWGVVLADDGPLVGHVALRCHNRPARQAEVGYVVNPEYAGRGYATEAARAALGLAFERHGFHRVFARIDAGNGASIAVATRLGMRREAVLVENDVWDGRWGSEVVYAILAREWRAAGASAD